MNTVSSEVLKTIGEILRRAFSQLQSTANVNSSPSGAGQPVSGVMGFIGNLFTSPGLFGFLGSGRPGSAALRGSLVGLASGVEAVTEEDATGKTTVRQRPLRAAFTVFAYFVEGIIAALIFRGIRRAARTASTKERPRSRRGTMQLSDVRQPHCRQALRASQIGWHKPG
jgi:hypothetical protein